MRRLLFTGVVLAFSAVSTPVAAAEPTAVTPTYTVTGAAKVSGTPNPYRMTLLADPQAIPGDLVITLRRTAPTGNHPVQVHRFELTGSKTDCQPDLSNCTVDDFGTLGSFGRVKLVFTPTSAATLSNVVCGGVTTGQVLSRTGTLTDTFRLHTSTRYFGSIRNAPRRVSLPSAIPAVARAFTPNGFACGAGPACQRGLAAAINASPYIRASKIPGQHWASLMVGWAEFPMSSLTVLHEISARVRRSEFRVTSNTPKALQRTRANFTALAPFASGLGIFRGVGDPSAPDTCGRVVRQATLGGAVTFHLDGYGTHTMSSGSGQVERVP